MARKTRKTRIIEKKKIIRSFRESKKRTDLIKKTLAVLKDRSKALLEKEKVLAVIAYRDPLLNPNRKKTLNVAIIAAKRVFDTKKKSRNLVNIITSADLFKVKVTILSLEELKKELRKTVYPLSVTYDVNQWERGNYDIFVFYEKGIEIEKKIKENNTVIKKIKKTRPKRIKHK